MPEDYYGDAAPPASTAPEAKAEPQEETSSDSQTAELPKSVLGGKEFKPGEEVVLEIVQVNEDSVIVKYATEKGEKKEEAAPKEGGGMSSLYEDGGGNPGPGGGY